MRRILQIVFLLSFALLGSHQVFASPAGDNIIISELEYDSIQGGGDRGYEWFELYNPTAHTIDISGYQFFDGDTGNPVSIPNGESIAPNSYYLAVRNINRFHINYPSITPDLEYKSLVSASNSMVFANGGDDFYIMDSSGTQIDFVSWEGATAGWNIVADAGESIARHTSVDTDSASDWSSHQIPTPGTGTLTMTNHAPDITSDGGNATTTIHIDENTTAVTTVSATDPDAGDTVSYAILDGDDQALFSLDANTGALTFNTAPDFENPTDANSDGAYEVRVRASDGFLQDVQAISVVVDDVNDAPIITSNGGLGSASISIPENTTAVTTVTATDEDQPAQTLTYSLNPGPGAPDTNLFTIDANTGELSFINAPDFENPLDQDTPAPGDQSHDNVYYVSVRVTDDGTGNLYDGQLILVTVTDVSESTHRHSRKSRRIIKEKQEKVTKETQQEGETKEETENEETTNPQCNFTYSRLLKIGVPYGEDVKALQTLLNSLGFNTGIADGWYGPKTAKGVKAFQKAMGIKDDGIVGQQTNKKILSQCSS